MSEGIQAFKGFDAALQCRGFQYEIGKTYTAEKVEICESGFHSCEMPLDCWTYYPPTKSRYSEVVASGTIQNKSGEDSKIASGSIAISAEIRLPEFIRRAVDWILSKAKSNTATGNYGHAAATGNYGHAAATGDYGHAAATGDYGHAAATGDYGHAAATGDYGHAAATGYLGHAAATGNYGHAAATGDSGHAAATGYLGHAAATGNYGHAAATGDSGHAAATGDYGHAAATGYLGHAAATGNYGHAAATGDSAIAASLGIHGKSKAGPNGWIVVAHWSEKSGSWKLVNVRTSKVGENGVKPNVFYSLNEAGEFEERDE